MLTLLPYTGQIVYDGTLRVPPMSPPPQLVAEIQGVVAAAVSSGSVISSMPEPVDAPLEQSFVHISGLKSRPDLNGTVAFAGEFEEEKGRHAVKISDSGAGVLIRPANLRVATEEEIQAAAPPGTLVGAALTPFQEETRQLVRSMPAGRPSTGSVDDGSFWVFRRMGYTERENPDLNFMILAGGVPLPPTDVGAGAGDGGMMAMMMDPGRFWYTSKALTPSADEILAALRQALHSRAWSGRSKPESIAIDAKEIVDRLEEILEPAGVTVGYYPPPSNEELVAMGHTPPNF
mmetsp:Transcript_24436/g.60965  ORF Transcript_24436/g.60965 Transcript_24436/m.60965 type:complete len:290 (+) Transcript_24436:676-1545(+)